MKLVVTVKSEKTFQLDADAFLVGGKYSLRADRFDVFQIKKFRALTNKELYVNVEKILHESELLDCEAYLLELVDSVDGFYYSDHAVYMLAKQHGFIEKLVYNPGTLVSSKQDASFYLSTGIKRVCLAREITLENIVDIIESIKDVEVVIHGFLNMFYSARNLLTNYFTYLDQTIQTKGYLEEEKRSEHYPIIQDSTGSHVFHGKPLVSFDEFKHFKGITCRIDAFLMEEDELQFVFELYKQLQAGVSPEVVKDQYIRHFGESYQEKGFYYKKTVYKK